MQSMLDVTLSVMIGGMLILSMFTAMTTLQSHSINQQIYINLLSQTENIAKILGGYYLQRLGLQHTGEPVRGASATSFRFFAYIDPGSGTETDTRVTIGQQTDSAGNNYVLVFRNDNPSLKLFGPFRIDNNGLQINCYDRSGNLTYTASDIYSVEIGFRLVREGINVSSNSPLSITNYVYVKKFLFRKYYH
jgi:hypothetical protein